MDPETARVRARRLLEFVPVVARTIRSTFVAAALFDSRYRSRPGLDQALLHPDQVEISAGGDRRSRGELRRRRTTPPLWEQTSDRGRASDWSGWPSSGALRPLRRSPHTPEVTARVRSLEGPASPSLRVQSPTHRVGPEPLLEALVMFQRPSSSPMVYVRSHSDLAHASNQAVDDHDPDAWVRCFSDDGQVISPSANRGVVKSSTGGSRASPAP